MKNLAYFLWKVSLIFLNSGIIQKTLTHTLILFTFFDTMLTNKYNIILSLFGAAYSGFPHDPAPKITRQIRQIYIHR